MSEKYKIMLVAGETSGDIHTAALVESLRQQAPEITFEFFGATGERMRSSGVKTIIKADELSIVGLLEIARALPMFWRAFQKLKAAARSENPDAVILTDFPDFNLKLARSLKKLGFPIVYYVSPQIWAWREYRLRIIKKYIDLLLTILPFEKEWYARRGFSNVAFVGNPLAGEVRAETSKKEFCLKYDLNANEKIIALLPGSRGREIARILPVMLETVSQMAASDETLQFVVALAADRHKATVQAIIEQAKIIRLPKILKIVAGATRDALNAADAAAVTSGTATLETAIIGTPMAIVYKTSAINYSLLRPLITVPHFGLVNLIAEKRLATELIQGDFTAKTLSAELFKLLESKANSQMRQQLKQVTETLGDGASDRAAEIILEFLRRNKFEND